VSVKNLLGMFQPEFRRDRELSQQARVPTEQRLQEDTGPVVGTIAANLEKVGNKAETILNEAKRLALVRRIPVPESATEVRAAVERQDPDSQGLFITFELYRSAYEYTQQQDNALPPQILDGLTGDPLTDSQTIRKTLLQRVEGINAEQAALLGNQILILYVLKLLQKGPDAVDTVEHTAGKQPPGTEVPALLKNLGLSIAAAKIYAGLNEQLVKDAFEELAGQVLPKVDIEAGRKALAELPMFQAALTGRRPQDYQTIVTFAEAFLSRQTENGWESWQVAPELQQMMEWARESGRLLGRYDARSVTSNEAPDDNPIRLQDIGSIDLNTTATGGRSGRAIDRLKPPETYITDVYQRVVDELNKAVDGMGYLLAQAISVDDLCCLLKWFDAIGPQPTGMIRTLMEAAQNATRKLSQLEIPSGRVNLSVSRVIHQEAMLLLHDLHEGIFKKMKSWLQVEPQKWSSLFETCPLLDELVEYLVFSLEQLEATLVSLLDRWLGYLEDQTARFTHKTEVVGNEFKLRFFMSTINTYLQFGLDGGICPDTPSEPMRIAGAVERILGGLAPDVALPVGDGDPYSTLQSPPLVLSNGITIPSVPGASAGISPSDLSSPLEAAEEVCKSGIVSQNLVPFPRG
jgi:hypothetical protein